MSVELYEQAEEAVNELFSDQSVSRRQTEEDLMALQDHIQNMLITLEDGD